jgi:hypothetical protein
MLVAWQNTNAVGILIEALSDQRVFDPQFISPAGNPTTAVRHKITVGKRAEMLLEFMLKKEKGSWYRVADWNKWWQDHKQMTLSDIRKEVDAAGGAR